MEKLNAEVVNQGDGNKLVKLPSGTVLPLDRNNTVRYDNVLGKRRYSVSRFDASLTVRKSV